MQQQLIRRAVRFATQFGLVILPKLLSGVGTAAISWVTFRYLSTAQFGALSLCLSAITLVDSVIGSAFDLVAVRLASNLALEDQRGLETLQRSCVALKVAATGIAGLLLLIFQRVLLADFFKGEGSPALLALTLLAGYMVLLVRSAQLQFQIARQFKAYGLVDLTHNGLKLVGIWALIRFGSMHTGTVVLIYVLAPAVVFLAWVVSSGSRVIFGGSISMPVLAAALMQARWFLLTFGSGWLVSRVDLWMVARSLTAHATGVYSAAQIVAMMPPLIGIYMSVVLSPRVIPLLNKGQLLSFTKRLQTALLLTAVMGYAMAWLLIPQVAPTLPFRYQEALPALVVLLPGALAAFVSFPLTLTTLMFLRPRFLIVMDCVTLPLILMSYGLLVPRYGVIGAAWIATVASILRATVAQIVALLVVRKSQQENNNTAEIGWSEAPSEVSSV